MNRIISCVLIFSLVFSCNNSKSIETQKTKIEDKKEPLITKHEDSGLFNLNPELILEEMTKSDVIKNFNRNYNISFPYLHDYGIDSEEEGILVSKDSEPLFFTWSKFGNDSLYEIQILNSSINVKPKIRVGMSIGEFLNIYPESKI